MILYLLLFIYKQGSATDERQSTPIDRYCIPDACPLRTPKRQMFPQGLCDSSPVLYIQDESKDTVQPCHSQIPITQKNAKGSTL